MSNKLQKMLNEIVQLEDELRGLNRLIARRADKVVDSITELSEPAFKALVEAQDNRRLTRVRFAFSFEVEEAFKRTPKRNWLFFVNKQYPLVLSRVKRTVRSEIINSGLFFNEQIKARRVNSDLESLRQEYAESVSSSETGLPLKKTDSSVPRVNSRGKTYPAKPSQAFGPGSHSPWSSPSASVSRTSESDLLDPFNPLNPLNPLSPFHHSHYSSESCSAPSSESREDSDTNSRDCYSSRETTMDTPCESVNTSSCSDSSYSSDSGGGSFGD